VSFVQISAVKAILLSKRNLLPVRMFRICCQTLGEVRNKRSAHVIFVFDFCFPRNSSIIYKSFVYVHGKRMLIRKSLYNARLGFIFHVLHQFYLVCYRKILFLLTLHDLKNTQKRNLGETEVMKIAKKKKVELKGITNS